MDILLYKETKKTKRKSIYIMGNSSSKSPAHLTREQEDLKYLGDRFAFGDAELWHLYQAYHAIFHTTSNNNNDNNNININTNISFLTDWAIQSTLILEQQERIRQQKQQQQDLHRKKLQQQQQHGSGNNKKRGGGGGGVVQEKEQQQVLDTTNHLLLLSRMSQEEFQCHLQALKQERLASLQVVEHHILPLNLGNRLYRAACVVHGDVAAASLYNDDDDAVGVGAAASEEESKQQQQNSTFASANKSKSKSVNINIVDEYTRRARLTQMFEGFSNMGRRGSKAYLQVMFQACCHQKQRRKRNEQNQNQNRNDYYNDGSASTSTITTVVVSALEMVDMGYRMALAAEYLQQRHVNFHNNNNSQNKKSDPYSQGEDHQEEHDKDNNNNNNTHDTDDDHNNKKVDEHDDDDNDNDHDNIMAVDVASLLPPSPSRWSLDDVSLSSSRSSSIKKQGGGGAGADGSTKSSMLNSSLRALARSMIEKGKRRQERTSNASDCGGAGAEMMMFHYPPPHDNNIKSDAIKNEHDDDNIIDNNNDDDDGFVELEDIIEWSEEVAPLFASTLPTLLHQILFPGKPYQPQQTPFSYPRILQESSFFVGSSNNANDNNADDTAAAAAPVVVVHANASPLLFGLACFSSSLSGLYFRLYTSASDGLSFNRLQNALLGYGGPTCIIIRAVADDDDEHDSNNDNDHYNEGGIFGAVSASPWKESKDFYGTSDCFLFQLSPVTAVYRPTSVARSVDNNKNTHKSTAATAGHGGKSKSSSGPNYMYCNPHARSKGYDGQAHGIGFGGTVDQPRLFLDETFEQCYAGSQDWTFENGALLPPSNNRRKQYFQVESLEVWGVGGTALVEKALDARQLARDVRQEGIRRARKVDKAQFLDDFRSGIMDSKSLFAHRQQIDGRADQDCNDRHAETFGNEK